MQVIQYIRYFFYIAYNWNIRIAVHILREEIKGEKKYGIDSTGADELRHLEKLGIDIENATIYMPVSYDLLDELMTQINLSSEKKNNKPGHFLDIGCGKGRALCVAAHHGFNKVTGIDFSKELCNTATLNCVQTKQSFPNLEFTIIHNDAFYFEIPEDVNCIFMFNPFDDVIMSGVAENILESYSSNPRKIQIIYVNPLVLDPLLDIGFKQIYHTQKLKYLEAVILELS